MESKDFNLVNALKTYKPFNAKETEHLKSILAFLEFNDNALTGRIYRVILQAQVF